MAAFKGERGQIKLKIVLDKHRRIVYDKSCGFDNRTEMHH